jgi:hypothetical protein
MITRADEMSQKFERLWVAINHSALSLINKKDRSFGCGPFQF